MNLSDHGKWELMAYWVYRPHLFEDYASFFRACTYPFHLQYKRLCRSIIEKEFRATTHYVNMGYEQWLQHKKATGNIPESPIVEYKRMRERYEQGYKEFEDSLKNAVNQYYNTVMLRLAKALNLNPLETYNMEVKSGCIGADFAMLITIEGRKREVLLQVVPDEAKQKNPIIIKTL